MLTNRLKKEGNESVTNCNALKMCDIRSKINLIDRISFVLGKDNDQVCLCR